MPAVDGLRGIAILLVALSHFVRMPRSGLPLDRLFWRVASVGWCGVDLFFVLSGFLITGILLNGTDAGDSLRNFYARRFLRVVPVYYVVLGIVLLVQPHLEARDALTMPHLVQHQVWYWAFASNILIARPQEWMAAVTWTQHFWSLGVEEQFYLVWPVLIWFAGTRHAMKLCVAALLVSVVGRFVWWEVMRNPFGGYVLTPLRFDGLATGAFVAVSLRSADLRRRLERWAPTVAILALGSFALLAVRVPQPQNFRLAMQLLGFPTLAIGFAAVLVLCLRKGSWMARGLSVRPLRRAGKYSYAMYLVHYPVVMAVASLGLMDDSMPRIFGSQLHSMLLLVLVAGTVSFLVAWLSWNLVERHALALKRFFSYGGRAAEPVLVDMSPAAA